MCRASPRVCRDTILILSDVIRKNPSRAGEQHNKRQQKAVGPSAPPAIVLSGYEPILLAIAPKWEMEATGSVQVVEKELAKMRLKIASATAAAVTVDAAL
jgi:hypothetical protein